MLITGFLLTGVVYAQDTSSRFVQERLTKNQKLRDFERYQSIKPREQAIIAESRKWLLSGGGWVDVIYTEFHNDDNSQAVEDVFDADLSVDTRLWTELTLRPSLDGDYIYEHTVYAKFRNLYISRWPNDNGVAKDDNDGPHTEMLYLDLDLKHAKIRTGRQYLTLGQGIVYGNVHDAIHVSAPVGPVTLESFVSQTLPHEENIDYSVPGFDKKSERYFVGGQAVWTPHENTDIYGFFLIQDDQSDPNPETSQDYAYNSQYWGLGSSFVSPSGYSLWGEYIFQTGSSAVFGEGRRSDVLAHAFNLGARYQSTWPMKPDFVLEYAFGSGDKDRTSVTNTEGGNLNGKDNNFLPFGYYSAGYALAPTLSNIHIFRAGMTLVAPESLWALRKVQFRTDGYFYWKDSAKGGIYDIDATDEATDIGREVDFTLYWPLVSDLTFLVQYGMFVPGAGFPGESNSMEIYLSTAATFTF